MPVIIDRRADLNPRTSSGESLREVRRIPVRASLDVARRGRTKQIAADLERSENTLARQVALTGDQRLAAEDLPDYLLAAGTVEPLRVICALVGGVYVPLPNQKTTPKSLADAFFRVATEAGELSTDLSDVTADGVVDAAEALRVAKSARDIAEAALAVEMAAFAAIEPAPTRMTLDDVLDARRSA